MEAIRALTIRRATAKFNATAVPEDVQEDILRAAMSAPAEAKSPWHFVLLNDEKTLKDLAILLHEQESVQSAPLSIVICADEMEQASMAHWAIDCAAAAENLVVAAHAKGLGSTWVRIFPSKERMRTVGELLGIPDHVTPFAAIFVGRPKTPLSKRAAPLETDRVRLESW